MMATVASSLLLSVYGLAYSPWIGLGLIASGLWLAWQALGLVRRGGQQVWPTFRSINLYALLVMALLVVDAML
jgi:4-hydroxybenzoate polyprenyltransferase